jgi:hypothetical protein
MKINFSLHLAVWVHYPNGKKKRVIHRRSRSYVQAFIDTISGSFRDSAHAFRNTSGTMAGTYLNHQVDATAGDTSFGIVIGTGLTDVLPENYALNTLMGHGNGAGQMVYQKQMWGSLISESNRRYFEIYRYFGNLYPLPQIVRECGIYAKTAGAASYYCFGRDLLGRVEVPPNGGLTIFYTNEITV